MSVRTRVTVLLALAVLFVIAAGAVFMLFDEAVPRIVGVSIALGVIQVGVIVARTRNGS